MAGNSFGQLFRITTAGESHGPANVAVVDGCPPGMPLAVEDLQPDLDRRRPGQSKVTTQRQEADIPRILSGVFQGRTTGTPIAILFENTDQRSRDYSDIKDKYRPGHADYTFEAKFGFRDYKGGGRASARETVSRVAAGAIARKLLKACGIEVLGYVKRVGGVEADVADPLQVTRRQVESNIVRCPDPESARRMEELITEVRKDLDSVGGVAEIVARGVPAGLGEPVFHKLKADLAGAICSIPAVLGFEYGAGFEAARSRGSENNDPFHVGGGEVTTQGNRHGGMLGGISSGRPLIMRAAVKPTSSIAREQSTVDRSGNPTTIRTTGRHDPCLLPRFVPVGEAMVLLVLIDHVLRWRAQCPEQAAQALPFLGFAE